MKKLTLCFALCFLLISSVSALAHQGIKLQGIALEENGLKFDAISIAMEPKNRVGSLFFSPSRPVVKPAGEKGALAPANNVGALKEHIVKAINAKINRQPLDNYKPITVHDVDVYGFYHLFTDNPYTDAAIFRAAPVGTSYRVKVTLTAVDEKNTVKTAIQGVFTVYPQ